MVAKMSMDVVDNVTREIYFNDVWMQGVARHFAKSYNKYQIPKKVNFLEAYVLELPQREGGPVCGVEKYIEGDYVKHSNNMGWVSDIERNTPHAFSHYTYEASDRALVVVDIQGVNDVYTDPQVHSLTGKGFGKGNHGLKGITRWVDGHRCNPICRFLKLPLINNLPINYTGGGKTIPAETHMAFNQISVINYDYNNNPAMPQLTGSMPKLVEADEGRSGCPCCIIS